MEKSKNFSAGVYIAGHNWSISHASLIFSHSVRIRDNNSRLVWNYMLCPTLYCYTYKGVAHEEGSRRKFENLY